MHPDTEAVLTPLQKRSLAALDEALRGRLASMGADDSGLYGYYVRKLEHDALLSQCDLQAIEILRRRGGQFGRIWEVGPGVGQLSVMLALDGHRVVAVEHTVRRADAMLAMLDVLAAIDSPARDRITVVKGSFPEAIGADEPVGRDAVTCIGCTFTAPDAKYRAFEAAIARYAIGVIDFSCLFTWTADRTTWRRRADDFASTYAITATPATSFHITEEDRYGELFVTHHG